MTYNSAYTGPQIDKAARLASIIFDDLPAMLADTRDYTAHTAGDVFWTATEGFRYRVAASGAMDQHLTTGGGVKLHVLSNDDGTWNLGAFNPAADGVTDDYAVFMTALEAVSLGVGTQIMGPTLIIPSGTYYMSKTIELKRTVTIKGLTAKSYHLGAPKFKFPPNTRGITVNRFDTFEGDEEIVPTGESDGSVIDSIQLDGTSVSNDPAVRAANVLACGIRVKAACRLYNVTVRNFVGDGFNISAAVKGEGGSGDLLGNASVWAMYHCDALNNGRNGLTVFGADANAGVCIGGNFTFNGEWGIYDQSFLGNTYIGVHTATNGIGVSAGNLPNVNGFRGGGRVFHKGYQWAAAFNPDGNGLHQASSMNPLYVTTEPGTDPAVWRREDADAGDGGTSYPQWQPGQPVGTYKLTGPMFFGNPNARTLALGCYSENDQNGSIYSGSKVMVLGGIQEKIAYGSQVMGSNGGALNVTGITTYKTALGLTVTIPHSDGDTALMLQKDGHSDEWQLRWYENDLLFGARGMFDKSAWRATGQNTTIDFGSGMPQPYTLFTRAIGIGDNQDVARRHTSGTAAPTTGAWGRGEIVWNRNASAGGFAGWICVTAGRPGTWKRFGAIEA